MYECLPLIRVEHNNLGCQSVGLDFGMMKGHFLSLLAVCLPGERPTRVRLGAMPGTVPAAVVAG